MCLWIHLVEVASKFDTSTKISYIILVTEQSAERYIAYLH